MAIIYSYPGKSPVSSNDTVVITDSSGGVSPSNATKSATMSTIASYVINDSGNAIALQRVLNDGATATPFNQSWDGQLTLSQDGGTDSVRFGVRGLPGIGVNSLQMVYNTDSAIANHLEIVGGVEFKTVTSGVSEKTFRFDKTTGQVIIQSLLDVDGRVLFNDTAEIVGVTTLNNDLIFNGNGDIELDSGNISKTNAGILRVQANGGISLDANNGSNPTIDMNSAGGIDITAGATGDIQIGSQFGGTGNIGIGNTGGTNNLFRAKSTLGVLEFSDGTQIRNITSGGIEITALGTGDIDIQGGVSSSINLISSGQDITLTTTNQDKSVLINGGDKLELKAQSPATYVKVETVTGNLPEGTPVYITSDNNGLINVEEADASDPTKMPVFGIVSTAMAAGPGSGEVVIHGVHEFSAGTIIPGGSVVANDPIYVDNTGILQFVRPKNVIGTATNQELQIIGRVIDPSTPDKIFINCVGYTAPEIISGFLAPELYFGATAIGAGASARGFYQVNGRLVTGQVFVDATPGAPVTITNSLSCRLALPGGGQLDDINNFPANNTIPGSIMINGSFFGDVTVAPTAGALVSSAGAGILLKKFIDPAGGNLNLQTITSGDVNLGDSLSFTFSYYTDN